ncbi:hypothetical protein TRIUR3_15833 [Triticum urartu]|uniref:Xylanase inhibitor C-terminal domain-containing protein n=1 Tax=Triticum urartu TaxID=4572 RepID=M8AMP0_TRIUA|nr:hypothetical protein TRIUR3_15833 [Triticum urartu]
MVIMDTDHHGVACGRSGGRWLGFGSLCFLLALLNSANHGVAGNAAPPTPSGGFSLPIVSNHDTAGGLGQFDANLTSIGPHIAPVGWPLYGVLVGVGSGQTRHFYKLGLDLVGDLTWMQCQPCVPEPRRRRRRTQQGRRQPHLRCAHTTDGFVGLNHGVLAGALSLSRHPTSFLRQLTARGLADSRFSYCLFPGQSHPGARHGFLRFGRDIPRHEHMRSTSLLFTGPGYGQSSTYYIRIVGISFNRKKLNGVKMAMFRRDLQTRRGGSVVDPGTPLTRLVRAAYDVVEAEVAADMHKQGARRSTVPVQGYHLCFVSWDHVRFPSLTFDLHEEATRLFIKPELLFVRVNQHLCFAVVPDEEMTVLGAAQQGF